MKISTRNRTIARLAVGLILALQGTALVAASLPADELELIACAKQLHSEVGGKIWPGWSAEPFDVLLIDGDTEYLICPSAGAQGFRPVGRDKANGCEVMARERAFPPHLLATFPAVSAVPAIVVGTPEETGKSPFEWTVTLLHEHFHQFEYSRPDYYDDVNALGLSGGDQTGSWMLNYPFPYDHTDVQSRFDAFSLALKKGLNARGTAQFAEALREVKSTWRAFREGLSPKDYRYFQFQVWQEGVARYVELRLAEELATRPASGCLKRFDPNTLKALAPSMQARIDQNLEHPALAQSRRVVFYSVGAAIAQLLDETSPSWKTEFLRHPFEVDRYFGP